MKARQIQWPAQVPELKTSRFLLRPFRASDAPAYFELNKNTKVMRSYAVKAHRSLAETQALITYLGKAARKHEMLRWGIFDKKTGEFIGDCGYWRFNGPRASAELGSKIRPEYWAQGVLTEVGAELIRYGFRQLKLNSVEGFVEADNLGSVKFVERLGFQKVGLAPRYSYSERAKNYVDILFYCLNVESWKKKKSS